MNADELQTVVNVLGALLVIAVCLGLRERPCAETCCVHRQSLARAEKAARQREVQHDVEHKGFGFRAGDPDAYSCRDKACPRNPR